MSNNNDESLNQQEKNSGEFPSRRGHCERETKESRITVDINLDGSGITDISTGLSFFDHMLNAVGTHGSFDLTVKAEGDIDVDAHHTVEDTAIVMGGITRSFGR